MSKTASLISKEKEIRRLLIERLKKGDRAQIARECGRPRSHVTAVLKGRYSDEKVIEIAMRIAEKNMREKQDLIDKINSIQ